MALTSIYMRALLRENGHLVLTGVETMADLREALRNLYSHDWEKCHRKELGAPIASLILDPGVFAVKSTPKKNVIAVDLSSESL